MRQALKRALGTLGSIGMLGTALAGQQALPLPDPGLQAEIRATLHAPGDEARLAALEVLEQRRRADDEGLTTQLFLYSAAAETTRDGMALGLLLPRLGIERELLVRAVVPFFESEDEALRAEAAGVMSEFEGADAQRGPSFAIYRPFLAEAARADREPPQGLLRHLFESEPGTALLLVMGVLERDPAELRRLLWAEHVLADAIWKRTHRFVTTDDLQPEVQRELDAVQRHPRWWARAYAAALQSRHPYFARAGSIEVLRRDAHPLVRRLAR